MFQMFKDTVLTPALSRIGTAAGTWLLSSGVASAEAEKIAAGIVALGLVGVDFAFDYLKTKRAVAKAMGSR